MIIVPATSRRAVAALVAALVVGTLGMHALASHGTPTTPAAASSTMATTGTTAATAAHGSAAASGHPHDGHAHA